jgi:tRNA(adenine34) deaminase
MMTHWEYMEIALEEATIAGRHGEVPVGAVLVRNGEVIARDHNRRIETGDPSAHAEMLVLRKAAIRAFDWRLRDATLYVTLEPCPMCAGAIKHARVKAVVYGAADSDAGSGGSAYNILEDSRLNHTVQVIAGIMEGESRQLLRRFFGGLR